MLYICPVIHLTITAFDAILVNAVCDLSCSHHITHKNPSACLLGSTYLLIVLSLHRSFIVLVSPFTILVFHRNTFCGWKKSWLRHVALLHQRTFFCCPRHPQLPPKDPAEASRILSFTPLQVLLEFIVFLTSAWNLRDQLSSGFSQVLDYSLNEVLNVHPASFLHELPDPYAAVTFP